MTERDLSFISPPVAHSLPAYLEPISPWLPPEDVEYLSIKGSFDIPSPNLRDAILRSYAEFVHPYYPLFDIDEFLMNVLDAQHQSSKVSLLVFQAVMFAGSAHVGIKPLRMMGFLTRKAARRALYQRTKVCVAHACLNWRSKS